jgi:hypothetical protein
MILLQSSEDKYTCYIETMNLDGETNLKFKQVKYEFGSLMKELKSSYEKALYASRE